MTNKDTSFYSTDGQLKNRHNLTYEISYILVDMEGSRALRQIGFLKSNIGLSVIHLKDNIK